MSTADCFFLIAGMAAVTYVPRAAPLMLLASRALPDRLMRWLAMVPPAVLAALLAPELLLRVQDGEKAFFLSSDNVFLLACLPTVAVGWISRSFFGTVATGMALVALLRWWYAL